MFIHFTIIGVGLLLTIYYGEKNTCEYDYTSTYQPQTRRYFLKENMIRHVFNTYSEENKD